VSGRRLALGAGLAAALMAASSWSIGAVPVGWQPAHKWIAWPAYYVGLAACVSAWLLLGRRVLAADRPPLAPRDVRRFVICSAAPLLVAAPFGRDLWAYAAQGHLVGHGLDPYDHAPVDVPGPFTDEVSSRWVHTPAPYGPVWLRLSQLAAWSAHGHPTVAVLVLRLPAFLGLLMCCWAITRLAERLGGRADVALWLGAASPLMSVLGVGGGHNDLLMLGAALAGLAVASGPGRANLALGAAIAAVGVLVKSPAAVAVAFTVPVWLHARGGRDSVRQLLAAGAIALGAALATLAAISASSGLGLGWTTQVNADAQWVSWLSLPSAAAMLGKAVTGSTHPRELDDTLRACRTVGELVAVVVLVALWVLAMSRAARSSARGPIGPLAAAFGVAALLGPSVQPWYYLWGLTVAGLAVSGRAALALLACVPLMFAVMITPSGFGWESGWGAPVVIVGAVLVSWTALRPDHRSTDRRRSPAPQ
jgi:alpha-1,6-mannosyltransferase